METKKCCKNDTDKNVYLDFAIQCEMLTRSQVVDEGVELRTIAQRATNGTLFGGNVMAEQMGLARCWQNIGCQPKTRIDTNMSSYRLST